MEQHIDVHPPHALARRDADLALTALADRQWGIVTRAQLAALGFDQAAITRRLRSGRLQRVFRGVYAVGHTALRFEGRLLAAVFACGLKAVVSHRSAAGLWEVRAHARERIDITMVTSGHRPQPGIDLHVTRRLTPSEITIHRGVPVTTVARTVADLATVVRRDDLARVIERADALELLDINLLVASVAHRPGATVVRELVAGHAERPPTRTDLEDRFLAIVRRQGLPQPEVNVKLHGPEVDFLWRDARLVVETDGREYHIARAAFERDRARDAHLAVHGYRVLRFSWKQVTRRPRDVADAIHAALGQNHALRHQSPIVHGDTVAWRPLRNTEPQ